MHHSSVEVNNTKPQIQQKRSINMIYNRNSQYDKVKKIWKKIKRADNLLKSISPKARLILSNVLYQIEKYGHAVLTHYELSQITDTERRQNCNLIKQLGFLLDITFERSIVIRDKKYRDCYVFSKNKNTEAILENPEEYFSNLLEENSVTSRKKLPDIAQKITRSPDPLHIYNKKEIKNNDNHDHKNQFKNVVQSKVVESVKTEQPKIATKGIVETKEIGLAEKEDEDIPVPKTQKVEFVETVGSLHGKQDVTSTRSRGKVIGKDGKEHWTTPLVEFRYTDSLLEKIISLSNKRDNKDYTPARVKVIMRNILEKDPDKQIYGGRKGFINYMVKAVNGETEYSEDDDKNKVQSIAMIKAKKQQELAERLALYKQGKLNQNYAYM